MSPVTSALIDYWHRLPAESVAARHRSLQSVAASVREGSSPRASLVAFALGDPDASVVVAAVAAYLATFESPDARRATLDDICEWVRRDLALNRGAVFAAALQSGVGEALAQLTSHRLALETTDVETVCRILAGSALPRRTRRYLEEWIALLDGTDGTDFVAQRTALRGLVCLRDERSAAAA